MNIYLAVRAVTKLDEHEGFVVVAEDESEARTIVDKAVGRDRYKRGFSYSLEGKYIGEETEGHILLDSFIAG